MTRDKKPDFPTKQLAILLACRLVEPLAVASVVPYLLFMVQHVGDKSLREDDAEATRIVTLLFAAYAGAQFITNMFWGRISDLVGRRPVMLLGLASTFVGTFGFGFSQSIPAMFFFRIVPGLLSGNVVIVRTIIGEITRGRENKATAFAWNQTAFQIGYVVGPIFGGYLSQPCNKFPYICEEQRFPFLRAFPFALPNLVISMLSALSLIGGYLFIEESLDTEPRLTTTNISSERSPLLPSTSSEEVVAKEKNPPWTDILTAPVFHIVLCYLLMDLHTICFDQIFPVFLATRSAPSHPPFQLNGGLELSAVTVANFVSGAGILSILLMLTVFPRLSAHIGSLAGLRLSLLLFPLTYFALPYLALLPLSPSWARTLGVAVVVCAKTLAAVFAFNESAVLLHVCAPGARTLGLVNGVALTASAGGRAVGPAVMGLFIELGHAIDCGALGWFFLALVAAAGAVQAFWVVDDAGEEDED
ncbi:major facilitator superfamily domain-containing protein [Hypoxylon cercidicola]|nr:major facilitator superfamily domain-containing protein [Hypoxylon cercidicola]